MSEPRTKLGTYHEIHKNLGSVAEQASLVRNLLLEMSATAPNVWDDLQVVFNCALSHGAPLNRGRMLEPLFIEFAIDACLAEPEIQPRNQTQKQATAGIPLTVLSTVFRGVSDTSYEVDFDNFLLTILHLSLLLYGKYHFVRSGLEQLLEEYIWPYKNAAVVTEFDQRCMDSLAINRLVYLWERPIRKVFRHFACMNPQTGMTKSVENLTLQALDSTMEQDEWLAFAKAFGIFPKYFAQNEALALLKTCDTGTYSSHITLYLTQFVESLILLAFETAKKQPVAVTSKYPTPQAKFFLFLETIFAPGYQTNFQRNPESELNLSAPPQPTITHIVPDHGPLEGGIKVTLVGENFNRMQRGMQVKFGWNVVVSDCEFRKRCVVSLPEGKSWTNVEVTVVASDKQTVAVHTRLQASVTVQAHNCTGSRTKEAENWSHGPQFCYRQELEPITLDAVLVDVTLAVFNEFCKRFPMGYAVGYLPLAGWRKFKVEYGVLEPNPPPQYEGVLVPTEYFDSLCDGMFQQLAVTDLEEPVPQSLPHPCLPFTRFLAALIRILLARGVQVQELQKQLKLLFVRGQFAATEVKALLATDPDLVAEVAKGPKALRQSRQQEAKRKMEIASMQMHREKEKIGPVTTEAVQRLQRMAEMLTNVRQLAFLENKELSQLQSALRSIAVEINRMGLDEIVALGGRLEREAEDREKDIARRAVALLSTKDETLTTVLKREQVEIERYRAKLEELITDLRGNHQRIDAIKGDATAVISTLAHLQSLQRALVTDALGMLQAGDEGRKRSGVLEIYGSICDRLAQVAIQTLKAVGQEATPDPAEKIVEEQIEQYRQRIYRAATEAKEPREDERDSKRRGNNFELAKEKLMSQKVEETNRDLQMRLREMTEKYIDIKASSAAEKEMLEKRMQELTDEVVEINEALLQTRQTVVSQKDQIERLQYAVRMRQGTGGPRATVISPPERANTVRPRASEPHVEGLQRTSTVVPAGARPWPLARGFSMRNPSVPASPTPRVPLRSGSVTTAEIGTEGSGSGSEHAPPIGTTQRTRSSLVGLDIANWENSFEQFIAREEESRLHDELKDQREMLKDARRMMVFMKAQLTAKVNIISRLEKTIQDTRDELKLRSDGLLGAVDGSQLATELNTLLIKRDQEMTAKEKEIQELRTELDDVSFKLQDANSTLLKSQRQAESAKTAHSEAKGFIEGMSKEMTRLSEAKAKLKKLEESNATKEAYIQTLRNRLEKQLCSQCGTGLEVGHSPPAVATADGAGRKRKKVMRASISQPPVSEPAVSPHSYIKPAVKPVQPPNGERSPPRTHQRTQKVPMENKPERDTQQTTTQHRGKKEQQERRESESSVGSAVTLSQMPSQASLSLMTISGERPAILEDSFTLLSESPLPTVARRKSSVIWASPLVSPRSSVETTDTQAASLPPSERHVFRTGQPSRILLGKEALQQVAAYCQSMRHDLAVFRDAIKAGFTKQRGLLSTFLHVLPKWHESMLQSPAPRPLSQAMPMLRSAPVETKTENSARTNPGENTEINEQPISPRRAKESMVMAADALKDTLMQEMLQIDRLTQHDDEVRHLIGRTLIKRAGTAARLHVLRKKQSNASATADLTITETALSLRLNELKRQQKLLQLEREDVLGRVKFLQKENHRIKAALQRVEIPAEVTTNRPEGENPGASWVTRDNHERKIAVLFLANQNLRAQLESLLTRLEKEKIQAKQQEAVLRVHQVSAGDPQMVIEVLALRRNQTAIDVPLRAPADRPPESQAYLTQDDYRPEDQYDGLEINTCRTVPFLDDEALHAAQEKARTNKMAIIAALQREEHHDITEILPPLDIRALLKDKSGAEKAALLQNTSSDYMQLVRQLAQQALDTESDVPHLFKKSRGGTIPSRQEPATVEVTTSPPCHHAFRKPPTSPRGRHPQPPSSGSGSRRVATRETDSKREPSLTVTGSGSNTVVQQLLEDAMYQRLSQERAASLQPKRISTVDRGLPALASPQSQTTTRPSFLGRGPMSPRY
eukprot:TRINITY_DN4049_c0_g1_i1.p1 TRINITY_DN4049_c0_g1~~TRINITY_DN4049_c0_g1_i1.p1  ORF type:complete len:2011 (-),score=312.16 TRINITY_DN4049_c0_g1_i1:1312-7344(-)